MTGTWYPPAAGTGGFLLTNPHFAMTDPTLLDRCIDAHDEAQDWPYPDTQSRAIAAVLRTIAAEILEHHHRASAREVAEMLLRAAEGNRQAILDSSTAPTDGPAVQGREPASVAPEAIEPTAAQSIRQAVEAVFARSPVPPTTDEVAAVVLRAALPHVLPLREDTPWELLLMRGRLLDIATELEASV